MYETTFVIIVEVEMETSVDIRELTDNLAPYFYWKDHPSHDEVLYVLIGY